MRSRDPRAGDARASPGAVQAAAIRRTALAGLTASVTAQAVRAGSEALATLVPVDCPACGAAALGMCGACRVELRRAVDPVRGSLEVGGVTVPIAAAVPYEGVAKRLIAALKDRGRLDPVAPLAALLRVALATGLDATMVRGRADARARAVHPPVVLVPAPSRASATRRRGFVPIQRICEVALPRGAIAPWLEVRGSVRDQAGLDRDDRAANLAGSMRASARARGVSVVLVDDVVTTGATACEGARALIEVGAEVIAIATIARTPRRNGPAGSWAGRIAGDASK